MSNSNSPQDVPSNPSSTPTTVLIERLRKEAESVKDCFTKFSFQALVFTSAVIGFTLKEQISVPTKPEIAYANVFAMLLCVLVARIGNYKYGTANRHFGYELFTDRIRCLRKKGINPGVGQLDEIGWEEAMRAWRVVQATCYAALYHTGAIRGDTLRRTIKKPWFEPGAMVSKAKTSGRAKPFYYSGSYLATMHNLLHLFALLSMLPILYMSWQVFERDGVANPSFMIAAAVSVITAALLGFSWMKNSMRRTMLEGGILSIPSCAIMWHAVIVCHCKAVDKSTLSERALCDYTTKLAEEAVDLANQIERMDAWLMELYNPRSSKQE